MHEKAPGGQIWAFPRIIYNTIYSESYTKYLTWFLHILVEKDATSLDYTSPCRQVGVRSDAKPIWIFSHSDSFRSGDHYFHILRNLSVIRYYLWTKEIDAKYPMNDSYLHAHAIRHHQQHSRFHNFWQWKTFNIQLPVFLMMHDFELTASWSSTWRLV
jgi:hypothetical protein